MTSETVLNLGEKPKGLVVEDDETWRGSFVRRLADAGLTATAVTNVREGLSALDREFFHVAMVDLSLVADSNRDGLKVVRRIYTDGEGTEAILLTAYGSVEEGAEAKALGAFHVFSKGRSDLHHDEIVSVVARAAEKAKHTVAKTAKSGLALLGGHGVSELPDYYSSKAIQALGAGYTVLNDALMDLLRGLTPFITRPKELCLHTDDSARTLVIDLWSKMSGRRVAALAARNKSALDSLEQNLLTATSGVLAGFSQVARRIETKDVAASLLIGRDDVFDLFAPQK